MNKIVCTLGLSFMLTNVQAHSIDPMFVGKWGFDRFSCRGIVQSDFYGVLKIKNSKVNQIEDQRYAGTVTLNILEFSPSPANELRGRGISYRVNDEENGNLEREEVVVDLVIVGDKLYSKNNYLSDNGQIHSYTLTYIKC